MSIFGKKFDFNALIEEYRKYRKAMADNPLVAERDILPNILKYRGEKAHVEGKIIEIQETKNAFVIVLEMVPDLPKPASYFFSSYAPFGEVLCHFSDFRFLGFSSRRDSISKLHIGDQAIIEGIAKRIFDIQWVSFWGEGKGLCEVNLDKDDNILQYKLDRYANVLLECSMISPEKI